MATASLPLVRKGFGATSRRDAWWVQPLVVFLALSGFIAYMTWAGYSNAHYEFGPYLSPLYSPLFFGPSPHAWFGGEATPAWWPSFLHYSAAALIVPVPVGFRLTCYYYRGAYYKAFWADPPSCAVGEPRKSYRGENSFPLILQNVHRYFLYLAIGFIVVLSIDAWKAMWFPTPDGGTQFGIGVGTLVLTINAICLGCYTFGCHSLRHLIGGFRDVLAGRPAGQKAYSCVSCLNRWHMKWAWISLCTVGFADLYVRLCSMGVWSDLRIL